MAALIRHRFYLFKLTTACTTLTRLTYLSMVSGFSPEVTLGSRAPLACGTLSSSSDIEGCLSGCFLDEWITLI